MAMDSANDRHFPLGGLVLVVVGGLALFDSFGLSIDLFRFWPLALAGFGLVKLLEPRTERERRTGAALATIGALLAAANLTLGRVGPRHLWPLLLILLGAMLMWQSFSRTAPPAGDGHVR